MININEIKDKKAFNVLKRYEGNNPYLIELKSKYEKKGALKLSDQQKDYIIANEHTEPKTVDKVIAISDFVGEHLQKKEELDFTPERIYFHQILAEDEKKYHILGKVKRNQNYNTYYWIPKTGVLDDPYFEEPEIEVDFNKYHEMDAEGRYPYDFQEGGIKFLLGRDGCILGDDMGLGKSLVATISALESGYEKILVICPSNMKITWSREIGSFTDQVEIVNGKEWKTSKFTIVNYDILKNFHTPFNERKKYKEENIKNTIMDEKFDLIIVDEAHKIKNNKSNRGKIVREVCQNGPEKVWLLTGTPIQNKPIDYYNLLAAIGSELSNNWLHFVKRYCDARKMYKTLKNGKKRQFWITDGASNLEELSQKTKNIILRRRKEDVLEDLPEKTITPVIQELTEQEWKEYDNLWDEYMERRKEEGKKGDPNKDLVELTLLREFIAMKAIPYTTGLVDDILEEDTNNKVIIFTTFNEEQQVLAEHFGKDCVLHNGSMSDKEKQESIDKFQNQKNKKVFIGNIDSAGVGITLTASNTVIFNSFKWVPAENEQAEDRAFRISQQNNVTVYYQLFKNTISEYMWGALKNKKTIINKIINEDENQYEILDEILKNSEQ